MAYHNDLGTLGEDLAFQFLLGEGFHIHARNKRYGKKEIDLLSEKDNILRVVEVKTVASGGLITGEDNLTQEKRQNLEFVLKLLENDATHSGKRLQLDFISVEIDETKRRAKMKLVQNIPLL